MCGISTIVVLPPSSTGNGEGSSTEHDDGRDVALNRQRLHDEMRESLETIKHRGPDASGVWISGDERIGTYGTPSVSHHIRHPEMGRRRD